MRWSGLDSDLKHLLKHLSRGGANLAKIKQQINEAFDKW